MCYVLKKSLTLIPIFLFSANSLIGQLLSNIEYNSGGDESLIGRIVYSYSVGGFAINTFDSENEIITQGYQQIDSIILQVISIDPSVSISAFPNPARDKVFIVFSTLEQPLKCNIEISNPSGYSTWLNQEYYFENEVPVEININRNKDGLLWLKFYEKGSRRLLGMVKVVLLN